ncbi:MAG: hypothetical protein M3Z13_07070, partial [Candidatus Dormibacteraeota bacterium]|nr:hypothetical protein [Candidatus Dormibacteraeota bacterium]
AAQHLLAKAMSLIVAVALGAAAIIALASGNVLGLAAANHWTEIGWGVVAAILLFNTMIPRRRRAIETEAAGVGAVQTNRQQRQADLAPTRTEPAAGSRADVEPAEPGTAPSPAATVRHEPAPSEAPTVRQDPAESSEAATVRHDPAP